MARSFHHWCQFRVTLTEYIFEFAGILDLHIRYMLEPVGHGTRVNRDVTFDLHGVLKAAQPIIVATIRRESERLLRVLKRYVETRPEVDDQ